MENSANQIFGPIADNFDTEIQSLEINLGAYTFCEADCFSHYVSTVTG
jgi:hypothetical protein